MATRQQRLSRQGRYSGLFRNAGGTARHLLVVYMDDPPPMRWSQDYYAQFAPTAPKTLDSERVYPRTPFLDWLAENGMQYTRATNTPVCSSGRASVQTGQYPGSTATRAGHGVGTIIRDDRSGDLAEFRDSGFTAGTPLATSLGAACEKAWIGKVHLSLPGSDGGLEWTICDLASGESGDGRLGDWDRRVLWLNNANQEPSPDGVVGATRADALSAGNVDPDTNQSVNPGGYYIHRYRDEAQERNIGTLTVGGVTQTPATGNGLHTETLMTDEAIAWWQTIDDATQRGFMLHTTHLCHSPFELPPPHTTPSTPAAMYALAIADPGNGDPIGSQVPVWLRQQAMAEAMDHELHRLISGMPAAVRANLTVIVAADNGVDNTYVSSLVDEGKDVGAHWVQADAQGRLKSTIYRYGVGVQMLAFGPTITAGTTDALVEVGPDLHETICAYFAATSGTGSGTSFVDTWDGTKTLANHDRDPDAVGAPWDSITEHHYFWPHGSTLVATQTELANKAQWVTSTPYTTGVSQVFNEDSDGLKANWVCKADHTSGATDDEPGVGATSGTYWTRLAERDVAVTGYTATGVSGEAAGVWKLVRHLRDSGSTDAANDELYYTHDADGVAVDEHEQDPLDVTAPAYNATYASLAAILDDLSA